MQPGGRRATTRGAAGLLAVALVLVLVLPAVPAAAENVAIGAGVEVTATAYRNGTTVLEMRSLEPARIDAQVQHWSPCRGGWMIAPLTAACGPVHHDPARFHQTQALRLQAGTTGTFQTTLGSWTVTCIAAGGAYMCQQSGDQVWDEPLVHTCSAKLPGTGVPGGAGLWDCIAQEE